MVKTKNPELEKRRRTQIMESVCRLLAEGSHRALTLRAVADDAGVSKGMVTYYFDSKDQLIAEAITHFLDQQLGLVRGIIRVEAPIQERMRMLIDTALPERDVLEWRLRFQIEVWSFAKGLPETLDSVRAQYVEFRRDCEEMLQAGIDEGYVTVKDAQWIYLLLYSVVDGLGFQLVLDPELDVSAVRERVIALFDQLLTS